MDHRRLRWAIAIWQITTHFARKGRDHIEHIDKAKCCKMEQCCGFTLRDRGIYSPNKPTWALGNEGPTWTKGKTQKVNKSLTTNCSSCVCVILALWVIVCLFVSKIWPGIARQTTVRMYQLVFSPYCYVYVFYSSSEWGLGVSLSSSQRIIACIWVFLALRVCVQVVNGARKTGISCLSTFYWVWFLCLFCVCLFLVVNGSGKRGIGLLGGNEGAQLLTLRSAGGEQRLNRTEIHLSIWNYFYGPVFFVNLDLRHEF